jgi:hypothetical protein
MSNEILMILILWFITDVMINVSIAFPNILKNLDD